MPQPQLSVYRHDRRARALITLAGEIDLASAPLVRASLARCLRDGVRTIDVDLTPVTFCDCSGLNALLHAARQTTLAGGMLRLHHPPTGLARILDLADCGSVLLGLPLGRLPSPRGCDTAAVPRPAPPHLAVPLAPVLAGDAR
ncbi:STAS domain-containing protein [Streptomyces europaeiscabiei]|uniref:STAS domain-containing protein n=1 Tax=Streptomyces europaeiscabiei TaxID=146819 RepID=UPI002E0D9B7B|nr:STAS domain-containing protein [Streptomyces europaeiscabiei]